MDRLFAQRIGTSTRGTPRRVVPTHRTQPCVPKMRGLEQGLLQREERLPRPATPAGEVVVGVGDGSSRAHPGHDPTGSGRVGEPRIVQVDLPASGTATGGAQPQPVALVDRGVRGAALSWDGGELPLSFANIDQDDTTLSITVHEAVHPDSVLKGHEISFTCSSTSEAEQWRQGIQQAVALADGQPWGVSKSFLRDQNEHWQAELARCRHMTVAQYFQEIGLGDVFDRQWAWCADTLADLETQQQLQVVCRPASPFGSTFCAAAATACLLHCLSALPDL
jgi:hypothetical protein